MKRAAAAVSLFLSFLLSLGAAAKDAPRQATPPNIIVIMTDDQRDVDPLDRMPNVQAMMVEQGVRFVNSFAVNPVCCASRASFLTGQYSHNDGVWDNKSGPRPGGFKDFKGDDNTIACWTQAAGYRTALIGKYLNGYGKGKAAKYIPPCWNYWWGLNHAFRYYDYEANDNGTLRVYGKRDSDYQEDVVSGLAQQFITQSTQPFFIWITGIAPHAGYPSVNVPVPPRRYKDAFRNLKLPRPPNFNEGDFADKPRFLRKYMPPMDKASIQLARESYRKRAETVLAADDLVGAIVSLVQNRGMLDNTYIVFTSDNGFFNGEHRLPVGKHLFYEESLRVPLVIRGPGIPPGQIRTEMVSNLDLSATLIELAGATPGRTPDGRSFVPLFAGDQPWRTAMLMEGADVLPLAGDETVYGYYSAVRSADYVYAEHVNRKEKYVGAEFYDLGADPYEVRSRPNDPKYRQIVAELKPMLASLRSCSGDSCWIGGALTKVPPQQKVKSEIGAVCRGHCRHLDLKHPLERAEGPDVR